MTLKKNMTGPQAVKHVEDLAKSEGISVPELLARAGVVRETLWTWKTKRNKPNPRTIIAIESVCTFNK